MWFNLIGVVVLMWLVSFSKALYEDGDYPYFIDADSAAYILSPNYQNKYPSGSSRRYKFMAPINYEILIECTVEMDKGTSACSTEYFYIARDGDSNLAGADQFCGSGTITRTSTFRTLVIAYVSGARPGSGVGGKFSCKLTARPQACDCGWSQSTRIVGGVEASKTEFPSMVGLYHKPSQTQFCGGTIINHRTIATAAHCTRLYRNPSDILIIAGDHDLSSSTESKYAKTYNVYKYIEHPSYDPSTDVNDIALLITTSDIEWSRGVGPICLPFGQTTNTFDYANVDVIGWGTTSFAGVRSNTLQKASVNIQPNSVCRNVYPALVASQVCTYFPGKDACQFDSGGPVVNKGSTRQYAVGIISYGFACGSNPGVNTRITSFLDWIRSNSAGNFCYKPYT